MLYPFPSVGAVYSEVMKAHGLDLDSAILNNAFRVAWKEAHAKPRVGVTVHDEKQWWRELVHRTMKGLGTVSDFDRMFEELWIAFAQPHRWKLHEGVVETLSGLKGRGYRLAILSNWDPRLRCLLDGFNLTSFFEEIVISSEVGVEKPDEGIFVLTQKRFQLVPENLLHVGDSHFHDFQGASKAGWKCLLVTHSEAASEKECDKITNLTKLLDLLP